MSKSPILAIDEIAQNQANKHITHNDAVAALEAAMNDILTKSSIGAGPVSLSETEATRYFAYRLQGATGNFDFVMPSTINGNQTKRVFAVRNETDHTVTVKAATGSGSTVTVYSGRATVLLQVHENIVPLFSTASLDFLEIGGTPDTYTGQGGKILAVKESEDGLEFVDPPEGGGSGGDPGATSFLELDDVPAAYEGHGGKLLAVKESEDGLEFVEAPTGGSGGTTETVLFGAITTGFPITGSVSTSGYATKGNTVRAQMNCRIAALTAIIEPELSDETYKAVIAKMVDDTPEIEEILAESDVWVAPDAGSFRVLFTFSEAVEIEEGVDYSFLIVRTDAGINGACHVLFPEQAPDAQPIGFTFLRAVREDLFPAAEELLDDTGSTTDYVAMEFYLYLNAIDILNFLPGLSGNAGKVLAVKEGEDGLEWIDPPSGSANYPDFTGNAGKILAVNQTEDGVEWIDLPSVVPVGLNEQTSNYTLALSDAGKLVRMDVASANDLTVPANSSVAFPVGTVIMVRQAGTGQTTIVADTGVTINTPETLKLRKQHSGATLIKVDDDEWDLVGDLELASS